MHAMISASATQPLRRVELAPQVLGSHDVRVRVRAAGVNPVDWKMREGGPLRLVQRLLGPRGPFVVGIDFAGDVVEIGAKVADLAVGDRVVGGTNFARGQRGSYADEVVVRPDQCARLPASVSYEEAACLPVAAVTASIAIDEHRGIGPGMRVLVLGATGGVGLAALQLARLRGATAVGVCSTRNVPVVEAEGAIAIDYGRGDALAAARAHGPFDLVLHAVGTGTYPLRGCVRLLAPKGIVELVVPTPRDMLSIALTPWRVRTVLARPDRARLTPLVAALEAGALRPRVEATFPLHEAEAAHARSRAGKVVGKLLLRADA